VLAQASQVLRLDMDSVASRVQELERECSSMRSADGDRDGSRHAAGGWRAWHGCKFNT